MHFPTCFHFELDEFGWGGGVEQDSRTSFPVARQRQTNGRTDRLKFLESGYPRENENWKVVKEEEEEYCNN
jgi:hypothetical protein